MSKVTREITKMSSNKTEKYEIPSILYEEPTPGSKPNPIPFINVTIQAKMPETIFIFEYRETGETEVGDDGLEAKIVDQIPHQYVDMALLKEKLPSHINDMVRVLLGMKPLKEAQEQGQIILDKVQDNIKKMKDRTSKQEEEGN